MTALRELAERWKDANRGETLYVEGKTSGMHACAAELLAILDAEGDGGSVACGYLITWNDPTYRGRQTLSFDRCSPDDGSFEPVYTHPARSGVVRDEYFLTVMELIEASRGYAGPLDDPDIGWRGTLPSHPDLFKCEKCGQEHLDCAQIPHTPYCRATRFLKAIVSSERML